MIRKEILASLFDRHARELLPYLQGFKVHHDRFGDGEILKWHTDDYFVIHCLVKFSSASNFNKWYRLEKLIDYFDMRGLFEIVPNSLRVQLEETVKLIEVEAEAVRIAEEARREASLRERRRREVFDLLDAARSDEADRLYLEQCGNWWPMTEYETAKANVRYLHRFAEIYLTGSLAELDTFFLNRPEALELSVMDYITLKRPKINEYLTTIGMRLDEEQTRACSQPEHWLLIRARAGSGKTRTLCARAALAIQDESLDPNQVLILAFNKAAAEEVRRRVQNLAGIAGYENVRTFHSLAYRIVKPRKKLLFDSGGHPSEREQSRFVQQMMPRILNPAFKERMVEFFRAELEQVEDIGRDLPSDEYFFFRRALEHVTLKGERVKSNGEKFVADFLFEHGIDYSYERAWEWRTEFLEGAAYRPDFSIVNGSKDYILEHWAIDPDDRCAELPAHWSMTAAQYRQQIVAKRTFWESKGITLVEIHSGMMRNGREAFERQLENVLGSVGIRCHKLTSDEIKEQVFRNEFIISRMAGLFLQFIKRAKKHGWSAEETARQISRQPDKEPRARIFHELALRAYTEYERMLEEQQAMDFDDLLMQAAEEIEACGAEARLHLGEGRMMPIGQLRWILLDEYQDFSELYFRMLEAILKIAPDVRLVAVGDDWQAINGFAGAELRFFERFADYFPGGDFVDITTNYRSGRLVVAAGNRLMEGRGAPAKAYQWASGEITVCHPGETWIQFNHEPRYDALWQADSIYLPPRTEDKGPSESDLRQAQALKSCAQIILESPDQMTMLLGRTNMVYGLRLEDFRTRLIKIMAALCRRKPEAFDELIVATTAHRSKGREAHTVIILDATQRQFPKIHLDNLLFGPFGVTPQAVLDEERRLFYVAVTRTEHRLFILTDRGEETPYLNDVKGKEIIASSGAPQSSEAPLSEVAAKIQAYIDTTKGNASGATIIDGVKRLDNWSLARRELPADLSELISALEASGLPVPEIHYYLPGVEEALCAEMAWPYAHNPVAILLGEQMEYAERWKSRGWRVPGADLLVDQIVKGVAHYVAGSRSKR